MKAEARTRSTPAPTRAPERPDSEPRAHEGNAGQSVVVVEGFFDSLKAVQAGFP
jgi:hypothetical protein